MDWILQRAVKILQLTSELYYGRNFLVLLSDC